MSFITIYKEGHKKRYPSTAPTFCREKPYFFTKPLDSMLGKTEREKNRRGQSLRPRQVTLIRIEAPHPTQ